MDAFCARRRIRCIHPFAALITSCGSLYALRYLSPTDEQDPLVSSNVTLILTTNAKLFPPTKSTSPIAVASSSAVTLDDTTAVIRDGRDIENKGYERYFDRPEVTAAYKKQQLIETPEFSQLSEDATVGGRFRPRAAFEEVRLPDPARFPPRVFDEILPGYRT